MNSNVKHPGLWITLIVIMGLGLRLLAYWQGEAFAYFTFGDEILAYDRSLDYAMGVDEARYLSQAKFSPNSYTPGALWTVFWLNAMRLGGGPHAVAAAMLLLNVCAIIFVFLLGSRIIGARAGLWAALFMATLPWSVYYSVGAYNPEVMAFFSSLTLLALWNAVTTNRSLQIFWVGFLPLIALQFHASAFALLCGALAVMGLTRKRLNRTAFMLGLAAGVLFYLPYAQGDAANGWINTRNMFGSENSFNFGCLKAISTPFSLLMSWCPRWTLPDFSDYTAMGDAVCGSFAVMFLFKALGTSVVMALIWQFFRVAADSWRGTRGNPRAAFERDPGLTFITAMIVVPLLIFLLSFQNYSSRYAIFQLPILVMIPAAALAGMKLPERKARLLRIGIVVTIIFNIYFLAAFFNYQGDLIHGNAKFVPSFKNLERVYRELKTDAGARRPIIVHDGEFMAGHHRHDAMAIAMYVRAREKEARMRGILDTSLAPARYDLLEAGAGFAAGAPAWRRADIILMRHAGND